MAKKTKLPAEGTKFSLKIFFFLSFLFSTVICLSDDDIDDNDKISTIIDIPIQQLESSTTVNDDNKNGTSDPYDWTIHRKDMIPISELPSKYSDIYKKPFEIRCSAIRFGIVEFNVESEVVRMKETEFEMSLTGKRHIE